MDDVVHARERIFGTRRIVAGLGISGGWYLAERLGPGGRRKQCLSRHWQWLDDRRSLQRRKSMSRMLWRQRHQIERKGGGRNVQCTRFIHAFRPPLSFVRGLRRGRWRRDVPSNYFHSGEPAHPNWQRGKHLSVECGDRKHGWIQRDGG